MKKFLLFLMLCIFAVSLSAQRVLNWKMSLEGRDMAGPMLCKVYVGKNDTCSLLERFHFDKGFFTKVDDSEGTTYEFKYKPVCIDAVNLFSTFGWSVDSFSYREGVANVELSIFFDGSMDSFRLEANKKKLYCLACCHSAFASSSDPHWKIRSSLIRSEASRLYLDKAFDKYLKDELWYETDMAAEHVVAMFYLSGWKLDFSIPVITEDFSFYWLMAHDIDFDV